MSGLMSALEAVSKEADDLFAVELNGVEIIFRLPSVKQASQYARLLELAGKDENGESLQSIIHEYVFSHSVQDRYLAYRNDDLPAGIPETVSRLILFLSGVDENSLEYTDQLFKLYREEIKNDKDYILRTICQVFPGYTFDSLEELNYQKLMGVFIQAEKVLLDRGILEVVHNMKSPEEAKEKPFRVEDAIKQDSEAHKEFEKPEHPEAVAQMGRIREEAIRRAKQEELDFKRHGLRK